MLKSPIHISSPDLSLIFRFMYLTNYLTPLFRYLVIPQTYHVQTSSVLSLLQRVSASPTASAFSRDLNSICHSFRPSELSYTFSSLSSHPVHQHSTLAWPSEYPESCCFRRLLLLSPWPVALSSLLCHHCGLNPSACFTLSLFPQVIANTEPRVSLLDPNGSCHCPAQNLCAFPFHAQ